MELPQSSPRRRPMTVPTPPPVGRRAGIMALPQPKPARPRTFGERAAEGKDVLQGVGVGTLAGLLGLPADLTALVVRDAPQLASKLLLGQPLEVEERTFIDKLAGDFQRAAGAEAVMRGMGFGERLDAPSDSDDALSRAGVNPFRQGAFAGEFLADPFLFLKAGKVAKGLSGAGGSRSTDALADAAAGDAAARAAGDGPDFGVADAEAGDGAGGFFPTDQAGEPVAAQAGTNQFDVNTDSIELIVEDFAGEPFNINQPEAGGAQLGNFGMFETPFMARNYTDVSPSQPIPLDPNVQRVVDDPYQVYEFGEDLTDPVDGTVIPAGTAILWPERARDQISDFFPELRIDMDLEPPMQFDPNSVSRAAALRGTEAERVANAFDDHLNSLLGTDRDADVDNLMDSIMSFDDASAARIVNDELGIGDTEDIPADALFLIRGRNMGTFPRETAAPIVSDTPQQGFTGVVDTPPEQGPIPAEALPPADPNTGSQLMSTTALNQRVLDIDPTQPFAPVADVDSVRVAASTTDPLREGRIADYSPLRQLIYSLPDDRPLSKAEIIETLSLDRGSTAYQKSLRNDLKGSGFLDWLETHGADEMMRGTLEVKYEELAPQVLAKNVVVGDGDAVAAVYGGRNARLPYQGQQDSIPVDYVIQNPDATNNRTAFTGQIYFSNPNSAAVTTRTNSGSTGITGIRTGRGGGIGDHNNGVHGMSADGGQTFINAPYGEKGVPGYFAHARYSVIEDSAGRRMMVYQEGQSSNVVEQNKLLSDPINALENIQRNLKKNLRRMRAPEFDSASLPEEIRGLDEAAIEQLVDSVEGIITRARQTKDRYDQEGIPSEGARQDIDTLLRTDPDTGAARPRFAGFGGISRQIDRATRNIYSKLHGEDERVFLTPKMKEDAELIASDGALYDALRNAEKSNISFDNFANVIDRSGLDIQDVPELVRLEGEFDARAPVAEMILAANDADTITKVFNFRSLGYNGNYQQRLSVIVNSIADTTDPDLVRKFNTAISDRLDQVLTIDGTAVDDVDMVRMELGLGGLRTDAADAPAVREAFVRLFEARQNGMTPHEYFTARDADGFTTGLGATDLNTLLTKDSSFFGYITHRGDPGDPLMAVNAARNETDVVTDASDVFDFIVKEKLTKEADAAQANVVIPENVTPKRFQELRKVFRASRDTINARPGAFDTDTPFANTTHFETFVPRYMVQEARRMGFDGVIFPSPDDMLTADRGSLSQAEKRARFKRQYGTHVDQGLKDMGVEVVDLPTILAKNQTTGNIEPMLHKGGTDHGRTEPFHTNARAVYFNNEANARASDPNKLIRRAKGGPVDLRPKKLIHSGIGAMARQVM